MTVIALWPTSAPARAVTQIDAVVEHVPLTQVLRRRGRQDQPGVSHRVLVVEGHPNGVKYDERIEKMSFCFGVLAGPATAIFPFRTALFGDGQPFRRPGQSIDPG
jgi:hypothetical protein